MFPPEVRIYPITDVRISGLSHAEQVIRLSEGGATVIQLREKHLPPREFYKQAQETLAVARQLGVRIVINDRVDIALATGADGVHLGQHDLPPEAARGLLGNKAIIGFSTNNVKQALCAARMPIDYLAIGPIYATSSKNNADPIVGLEGLRNVRKAIGSLQLVAIGGISHENATLVLEAGADAVALISGLLTAPKEIIVRTKHLLATLSAPKLP